jgi:hypothetical protein
MQNKISTILEKKPLRKKLLFLLLPLLLLSGGFFGTEVAYAVGVGDVTGWFFDNTVVAAFKYLLYSILWLLSWFTAAAVALFAYAVDPQNMSGPTGLLNLQATYDMWKFVRDFINIFFILGLLFIAFAFVFQIESYSNSKAIIKLIIAALLVNFSFPIARIIIDLANVPMYFFLQMILGDGDNASVALSSALGSSALVNVLVPTSPTDADVSTLLAAIIFLFIFTITILVLAMQLMIRLIALVLLIILSPIGFVASGIPGMKKYGTSWWDNFLKYTFVGPAVIFMLVIATNFFAAISSGDQFNSLKNVASSTAGSNPGFIASMAMFFIPIAMLWFTMGLSSKLSIAGASVATKYGQDFAKLIGKKAASPVTTRYQGIKKGVGKGLDKGNIFGVKYGNTKLGKYATGKYWDDKAANTEAFYAGGISGGSKGVKNEQDKARRKRVEAKIKDNKESAVSWSQMIQDLDSTDEVTKQAASLGLAESGGVQSTTVMYKALDAVKDKKGVLDEDFASKILEKSKGDSFDNVSDRDKAIGKDANGNDITFATKYAELANDSSMYLRNKEGDQYVDENGAVVTENNRVLRSGSVLDTFNSKAKGEGEIMVRINFDADQKMKFDSTLSKEEARLQALRGRVNDLNADTLAKQGSIFKAIGDGDEELITVLKERAEKDPVFLTESMKKMKAKSRQAFFDAKIMPESQRPVTKETQEVKEKVAARKEKRASFNERAENAKANKNKSA